MQVWHDMGAAAHLACAGIQEGLETLDALLRSAAGRQQQSIEAKVGQISPDRRVSKSSSLIPMSFMQRTQHTA